MFASWPGNMRGPRVKTPLLLLLLLLLTTLTGTVLCQDEDDQTDQEPDISEPNTDEQEADGDTETSEPTPTDPVATSATPPTDGDVTEDGSGQGKSSTGVNATTEDPTSLAETTTPGIEDGLTTIIILIPVVLVVLIIGMIVCGIYINRRWNQKARNQELRKEDPYLDGSSTEKVPMPMFEEDVPSVLELEMEELDQWMKKDGTTADDSKHA